MLQVERERQCSKGDQCCSRHENNDRPPKPTPKAAPPSKTQHTRGRSASRKRSVSGRSLTGRILRQPCRYYLQGTCIVPSVNSVKKNRDAKQGTSVCSRTTRLKNNHIKSRKRSFDKAVVKVVPQLNPESIGLSERRRSLGKTEA